jgi:hypothetical protein
VGSTDPGAVAVEQERESGHQNVLVERGVRGDAARFVIRKA